MNRLARRARAATVLVATIAAMSSASPLAVAAGSSAAAGERVPFKDSSIAGSLTFCGRSGQPVTSGSLDSVPFVWSAISSAPAPAHYRLTSSRATLAAYQPLKYVDPSDWSGTQLTGSSSYTNADHPVAQATNADAPLLNFVQAYPPHWQGLIEIRMLFSGINQPQHISPYPAAVVRVTGSRWTLVSGGGGSCSESKGVSDETKLLPKKRLASPQAVVPDGQSSASPAHASSTPSRASTPAAHSSASSSSHDGSANLAAESSSTGMSSGAKTGIGLGVLAVIGVLVIATLWWRRRPERP